MLYVCQQERKLTNACFADSCRQRLRLPFRTLRSSASCCCRYDRVHDVYGHAILGGSYCFSMKASIETKRLSILGAADC